MHHQDKQRKAGQLVNSYLITEAGAPTSSKKLLFFLSRLNSVQLWLLVVQQDLHLALDTGLGVSLV